MLQEADGMSQDVVSCVLDEAVLSPANTLQQENIVDSQIGDVPQVADVKQHPKENSSTIGYVGDDSTDASNGASCKTVRSEKDEGGYEKSDQQPQCGNVVKEESTVSEVHSERLFKTLAKGDTPATTTSFTWHVTSQEPCKEDCPKTDTSSCCVNDVPTSPSHCMVTRKLESRRPSTSTVRSNKRSTLTPRVTVDVSVCDRTMAAHIESGVGISVMFFCKKCRSHSSTSLTDVSDHAMTCDTTTVVPVKRKRGRPRLNCTSGHKAVVTSSGTIVDPGGGDGRKRERTDNDDGLPRKRGRPRLHRSRSGDDDRRRILAEENGSTESCVAESVTVKTELQEGDASDNPMNGAEHNYATSDAGEAGASDSDIKADVPFPATEGEDDNVKEEDTEEAMGGFDEPTEPRRWFCSLCPSTLLHSGTELDIHRQCHVHNDDGSVSLNCYICGSDWQTHRSHRWYVTKRHLRLAHRVDFRLACDLCDDVTFEDHESLNRHVQRAHKRRCRFRACKFSATSARDVETHERCHDDRDPTKFRCYLCGYRPRPNKRPWFLLHSHLVASHPGVIRALYQCRSCDRGYQEMQKLVAHAASCGKTNKLTCIVCAQKIHPKGMVSHMRSHVDREATSDAARAAAVKTEENDSDEHKDGSTEGLQDPSNAYTCSRHRISFASQDELTQHFVEVHWGLTKDGATGLPVGGVGENPVKCPFCYKKFATCERFDLHVQYVHAPDKMGNALCTTCGKKFLNGTRLRNHVREVHEGKRRTRVPPRRGPNGAPVKYHMCDKCVYSTPILLRLRNHYMSEHEGVHPYACDRCEYKTNEKSDLRRHKLKHYGLKRYRCDYCPYKTDTRWVLVKHCHSQHGVELPRRSRDTLGCRTSKRRLNKKSARRLEALETVVTSLPQDASLLLPGHADAFHVLPADPSGETYHVLEQGTGSHIQILNMDEALPGFDIQHGHELAAGQLPQYRVVQSTSQPVVAAPDVEQELHVVTSGDAVDLMDDGCQQYEVVSTGGEQLAAGQRFQIVTDADGVQQIQVVMDAEDLLSTDYQVVSLPHEMHGYDEEYQLVQGIVPSVGSQEVIIDCGDTAQDETETDEQVVYAVGPTETEACGTEAAESTLLLLAVSPDEAQ